MTIFGHLPPASLLAWERNWQVPSISPNTSVSSWPCSLTAQSADSGFTIPTTSKWTCCTRHPTPVKWRHWSCLEMRQTGVWQEQSGGGSKAELQGHDFLPHRPAVQPTVRVQSIILKARSERQVLPTRQERKLVPMGGGWGHMNHSPTAWHFPVPTAAPMDPSHHHHHFPLWKMTATPAVGFTYTAVSSSYILQNRKSSNKTQTTI